MLQGSISLLVFITKKNEQSVVASFSRSQDWDWVGNKRISVSLVNI